MYFKDALVIFTRKTLVKSHSD